MRAGGDILFSSQGLYKACVFARVRDSRENSTSIAARNLNRDGEIRTRDLSHPNQPTTEKLKFLISGELAAARINQAIPIYSC
jgi:hypothetical protein